MYPHDDLIDFAAALDFAAIPPDVLAEARRMVLDSIACIIAARATESAPAIEAAAGFLGTGMAAQTYRHARYADLMDYNEGYAGAHFGCGAIAAALALGCERGAGGRDLLAAVVAGFETGARVKDAMGPYYAEVDGKRRFLPVWGIATPVTYAAVAAAANVLGLRGEAAVEAFSLAGGNSPVPVGGVWSKAVALPNTKYCDAGWAALAGVMGAVAAQTGSTGLTDLLNDENGLLAIVGAANAEPAALSAGLGTEWRSRAVLYKRWPCCGLVYGALMLAEALMADHGIRADAVQAIRFHADPAILIPRFRNRDPQTQVSLQFSVPHNLAMLLAGVPNGPLWQSSEVAARPDVVRLRQAVVLEEYRPASPGGVCAIEIDTATGTHTRELTSEAALRRGFAVSDETITAKFRAVVAAPQAEAIIDMVMGVEDLASLTPLAAAIEEARAI